MNFSEFLREEEELALIDEALVEEGVVGGTMRAVKGFGGNLLGQTRLGAVNIASGATRALGGVGKLGLGTVQGLSGGGRQAVKSIGSGLSDVVGGVGDTLKGTAQAAGALSGVTPIMRGVQAASEKSLFTPMSSRRNGLQTAMGLNSWDPDGDARKDAEERWERLLQSYRQAKEAKNQNLKRKIKAEMEVVDKKSYDALVAQSKAARAERDRRKWKSVADRVGSVERPEDFLGRLATEQ